jgi:hypothetical protein
MATLPREVDKAEFSVSTNAIPVVNAGFISRHSVFDNDHSGESNIKSGSSTRSDSRSRSSSNSSTATTISSGRSNRSSNSSSSSSTSTRKSMAASGGYLFDSDAKNGATDEELNGIISFVPAKPVRHSSRKHDRRKMPAQIRSPTTFKQDNVKVTVDESLKRVGHWPEFTISEIEDSIQVHPKRFGFSPKVDIDAAAICIERGQRQAQQVFSRESLKHHFSKPKTPSVDSAAQLWRDKAKILGLGRGDPNSSTSKYLVAALFSLASLPKT